MDWETRIAEREKRLRAWDRGHDPLEARLERRERFVAEGEVRDQEAWIAKHRPIAGRYRSRGKVRAAGMIEQTIRDYEIRILEIRSALTEGRRIPERRGRVEFMGFGGQATAYGESTTNLSGSRYGRQQ